MTVNEQDLKRLRRELERDLEALQRVEALLDRKNSTDATPAKEAGTADRGQLKQLCIEALKEAGASGMRPKSILSFVKTKGRTFTSEASGSGAVSTVLRRLLKAKKLEKKDGIYVWKNATGRD